ncbi:MAG: hydantoinase/carbamoylase family amidase [Xanthobacteraceae bacterium]|nr:hydantoinase/carbamoylase family amidase [Xanthobacteraceae bacterium]
MALARFGALANGGVNRQALSEEEIAARAELVRWGRAIGLAPFTDAAGNLFLRLEGRDPSLPPVLVGSHIDSQPSGGKFDGVFGVLAALEVQEAFLASGRTPLRAIETVAWMNEEGSRFAPGMMGSALYAGARQVAEVLAVRDAAGESVETALKALLARDVDVPQRALGRPAAAFLEAHIEQGPVLELEGKTVGVVTGIQGKRTFRVTVTGEENHAGTAPRSVRRDALLAAAAMIGALDAAMRDAEDVTRFTVGRLEVTPNAPSVVPAKAVFSIDLRHPDAGTLQRLGDRIAEICRAQAGPARCRSRSCCTIRR